MANYIILLFVATFAAVHGAQFTQCGGQSYGKLVELEVSPDPIELKEGKGINIKYKVNVAKTFPASVKYDLVVNKIGWFGVKIPLCGFLGDLCTGKPLTCQDIEKAQAGLPDDVKAKLPKTPCPLTPGVYEKVMPFTIPTLPSIPSFLANGEYELKLKLKDASTGEEVACGEVTDLNIEI